MNKKDRRHSGRVYPRATIDNIEQDPELDPKEYWNDWIDRRDGMRGKDDHKKKQNIHAYFVKWFNSKRWNKKIRNLLYRRKKRKNASKTKH